MVKDATIVGLVDALAGDHGEKRAVPGCVGRWDAITREVGVSYIRSAGAVRPALGKNRDSRDRCSRDVGRHYTLCFVGIESERGNGGVGVTADKPATPLSRAAVAR